MTKPKIYVASLEPVEDDFLEIYRKDGRLTIVDGKTHCTECLNCEWWLLPEESAAAVDDEFFMECLKCGDRPEI